MRGNYGNNTNRKAILMEGSYTYERSQYENEDTTFRTYTAKLRPRIT